MLVTNNKEAIKTLTELANLGEEIENAFPQVRNLRVDSSSYKKNSAGITDNIAKYRLKIGELVYFLEKNNPHPNNDEYNTIKKFTILALETIKSLEQQYRDTLLKKLPTTPSYINTKYHELKTKQQPPPESPKLKIAPQAHEEYKKLLEFRANQKLVGYYKGELPDKPKETVSASLLAAAEKAASETFTDLPKYLQQQIIAEKKPSTPQHKI
jgi:hypothetical protein